jgi:uncharacterized iron-regulated membrane protein
MATITVKRCIAALFVCAVGLTLSACGANYVADYWPHFAGGEPNDVPPRPGSPGYRKFIEHGQSPDSRSAPAANGQPPAGGVTPEFAARQPGGAQQAPAGTTAAAPAQQPVSAAPPPRTTDQNVGQGGLY